jgi:hypothetical protein
VPFGEYMPLRGLLSALGAPTGLVPRDAVPGTDPAYLTLPDGTRVAVVISWEVFFGGRVRDGVEHGGEFVINPTNGSSYTWTVLQTQQIASSSVRHPGRRCSRADFDRRTSGDRARHRSPHRKHVVRQLWQRAVDRARGDRVCRRALRFRLAATPVDASGGPAKADR